MEVSKKKQFAGDHSTQTIVDTVNNYYAIVPGVTEEKVRSMMLEMYEEVSSKIIEIARRTADERVMSLSDRIIPKMMEYDNKLEFLKEPSIQRAIQIAQRAAACTDKEVDWEIISDLLIERIKNRGNRKTSVFLERAMEVVDSIPEDCLQLISLLYIIVSINPENLDWWYFKTNISSFESIVKKIMQDKQYPMDDEWIEVLDTLSLIKSDSSGGSQLCKFVDVLTQAFPVYFTLGIQEGCEEYETIKKNLIDLNLPWNSILIDHPYIRSRIIVNRPYVTVECSDGSNTGPMSLTEDQDQYLSEIQKTVNASDVHNQEVRTAFMSYWNSMESLKALTKWWDQISMGFDLTSIGRLIAKTNLEVNSIL